MRPISERMPEPTADRTASRQTINRQKNSKAAGTARKNYGKQQSFRWPRETTDRRMTETMTEVGEKNNRHQEIETITMVRTETETTAVRRTTGERRKKPGRKNRFSKGSSCSTGRNPYERNRSTPVELMTAAITTIIIERS